MPLFDVFIEFYGKKLKTVVEADSHFKAEQKVRERLHILKVNLVEPKEEEPTKTTQLKDFSGDIFDFFKGFGK